MRKREGPVYGKIRQKVRKMGKPKNKKENVSKKKNKLKENNISKKLKT